MFTTKYKPNTIQEFIGNKETVLSFIRWILNWDAKNTSSKCALISGKNGIGKTLLVDLLFQKLDFNVINLSIDDERDKEHIKQVIMPLLKMKKTVDKQENCLLVSDIDGGGDYGFISCLLDCIKESEIPVICICDDRYDQSIKPILHYCRDMKLTPPTYNEVYPLLYKIIMEEKIKINKSELEKIYEESGGDIRYILNTLQMFIKKKDMHKDIQNSNIFEIAGKLLSLETGLEDKIRYYKMAEDLNMLMIQENYISSTIPHNDERKRVQNITYEADAMSDSDILASTYNFELMPYIVESALRATSKCSKRGQIKFPQFLGRISTINKNKREKVNYETMNNETKVKKSAVKKVKEKKVKEPKPVKEKKEKPPKPVKEKKVKEPKPVKEKK